MFDLKLLTPLLGSSCSSFWDSPILYCRRCLDELLDVGHDETGLLLVSETESNGKALCCHIEYIEHRN